MDELLDVCRKLNGLCETASAIVQYSQSIAEGQLESEGSRYVMRPDNFVIFEPHYKRVRNLTVTIRGNPSEFEEWHGLKLDKSMNGYSSFRITQNSQLAAAASYIRRSKELFVRGRSREQTKSRTVE
jgi:hypothetical protein